MNTAFQLPPNWKIISLEEAGAWVGGGTPSKANPAFWSGGSIPWVSPKDMKTFVISDAQDLITADAVQQSATRIVPIGAVLVVTRSGILAHTLPVAITDVEVALNQDIKALIPSERLYARYLAYFLIAEESAILRNCKKDGTTVASIELSRMLGVKVPLAPVSEQRRIVAAIEQHLSDVDAGVAALERILANLKRYRASVLKAACEGRLVPTEAELARKQGRTYEPASVLLKRIMKERRVRWEAEQLTKMRAKGQEPRDDKWKAKYEDPKGPEMDLLPDLSEGWVWLTIEQAASDEPRSLQSGPFGSALLHSEFQSTGVLAIGIDNVQDGRFSMGRQNRIGETKFDELAKFAARPLDILITVMATVGRTCVIPANIEMAIITKHVYRITIDRALANPFYVMQSLRGGSAVRAQLFGNVQGQTRPGINGEILRKIALPLPPLAEQHRIVAEVDRLLSVADETEQLVRTQLARAERLRQSILKRAFEGKLVPQDPNDEPASVLLERIRSQSSSDKSAPRAKKKARSTHAP